MQAKKEGNAVLSDGFKLAANSVYGKSNDINSFLYDPQFTMQITLNGQLLLTMLAEKLVNMIPNLLILQINTDGITVKIKKGDLWKYQNLCRSWENLTNLNLEYVEYSKMIIRDVNNYLAVDIDGKIKCKGAFEVDKVVGSEPAYHKDNSFRIVPLAIQEYFVKGISIEETILTHRNIYDFCGRQKFTKDSYGQIHYLENKEGISYGEALKVYELEWEDYYNGSCYKKEWREQKLPYDRMVCLKTDVIQGIINNSKISITHSEKQQKNVRYYISNKGATFYKYYNKGTSEVINKGFCVTIFNRFIEKDWNLYDIDYSFYIRECRKILDEIENKQLTLL